jgi:hypothetical protein
MESPTSTFALLEQANGGDEQALLRCCRTFPAVNLA